MGQGQLADTAASCQAVGALALVSVKFGCAARAIKAFVGVWLLENLLKYRVLRLLQLEICRKCFRANSSFNIIICRLILAAFKRTFETFTFLNNVNQIFKIFRKTALTEAMVLATLVEHIQQLQPFESALAHRTAKLLAELRRLHLLQHQSWWIPALLRCFLYPVS
jgi:hypothetical protein